MTGPNLYCVYKSGGDYRRCHVEWLRKQVYQHTRKSVTCITDEPKRILSPVIPLSQDWPGWWSKIELFRPDLPGSAFFMDLDTVIVSSFMDILSELNLDKPYMMKDVYRPDQKGFYQSSIMYIPYSVKKAVYEKFIEDPHYHIRRHATYGDQGFIGQILEDHGLLYFQDQFPGEIISYKVHVRDKGLNKPSAKSKIVVFHGVPRPWSAANASWIPSL